MIQSGSHRIGKRAQGRYLLLHKRFLRRFSLRNEDSSRGCDGERSEGILVFSNGARTSVGISLLEIMVAVCILALAFFPLMRSISSGSVQTVKINNLSKATRLVQELIEEGRHTPVAGYEEFFRKNPGKVASGAELMTIPEATARKMFSKTWESLEAFRQQVAGSSKDFQWTIQTRSSRNAMGQIVEIYLNVEVSWVDRGTRENADQLGTPIRIVRAGGIMYNAESM